MNSKTDIEDLQTIEPFRVRAQVLIKKKVFRLCCILFEEQQKLLGVSTMSQLDEELESIPEDEVAFRSGTLLTLKHWADKTVGYFLVRSIERRHNAWLEKIDTAQVYREPLLSESDIFVCVAQLDRWTLVISNTNVGWICTRNLKCIVAE